MKQWPLSYKEEADLLSDAEEYLSALSRRGVTALKIRDRYTSGYPDILCCVQGKFVGVELKDDTGVASPQQELIIKLIKKAGGVAGVCRNIGDIVDLLNEAVGYECYRANGKR